MKKLYGAFLTCLISQSVAAVMDYQKLNDQLTHAVNVFAVENVFEQGISDTQAEKWKAVMAAVQEYITHNLDKSRSFGQGISNANRETILAARGVVDSLGNRFIPLVKYARLNNFNFAKDAYSKITPGNIKAISQQIDALVAQASVIERIKKTLTPGFTDILDVKNMKAILSKALTILDELVQKYLSDWSALQNKIAVGAILQQQQARGTPNKLTTKKPGVSRLA